MTFARVRAFAVHVFTACGAALALLALIFATGGHWAAMFFCLGLALIVDGVDGPLARDFKVAEVLPRWSGDDARSGGRFHHLCVRAGLCDRRQRAVAGRAGDSGRRRHRRSPARSISPTAR